MSSTPCAASKNTAQFDKGLLPKLLSPTSSSDEALSPTRSIASNSSLGVKLEARRQWNASLPLGFLWSVERVEINVTQTDADNGLVYIVEVFLRLPTSRLPTSKPILTAGATCPTFTVERRFSDFEELRRNVSSCVSMERQCACQYCLKFVEHIRFSGHQPRGLVKRFGGEKKRMKVLQNFVNDFVTMGQRRVEKKGKRKCEAQQLVPDLLAAFLLNDATY